MKIDDLRVRRDTAAHALGAAERDLERQKQRETGRYVDTEPFSRKCGRWREKHGQTPESGYHE